MLDEKVLKDCLAGFHAEFAARFERSRFLWQAVAHFNDCFDIDAGDFAAMLKKALAKTGPLLNEGNERPGSALLALARAHPEDVRGCFRQLFEGKDSLASRIDSFRSQTNLLAASMGEAAAFSQRLPAISVYLWLRHPTRFFPCRQDLLTHASHALGVPWRIGPLCPGDNLVKAFSFMETLRVALFGERLLMDDMRSRLDATCFTDATGHTLTRLFLEYVAERKPARSGLTDAAFAPDITPEEWLSLLARKDIFDPTGLSLVKTLAAGPMSRAALAGLAAPDAENPETVLEALSENILAAAALNRPAGDASLLAFASRQVLHGDSGTTCHLLDIRPALAEALHLAHLAGARPAAYGRNDFLGEVYMEEADFDRVTRQLLFRKNLIFQGAPGVGKTYAARRLAWALMGEKDDSRIAFVQFHPNVSYEDFVMGYRPEKDHFVLTRGIFCRFCEKAAKEPGKPFFFLIDEINRGNLGKIFGELLVLIEEGYRETPATLLYSGQSFSVPKNLYIIGMMNTADRSLAMIDYALRRRFGFFSMKPGFASTGFVRFQKALNSRALDRVIDTVMLLYREIAEDAALGPGFQIGHSHFAGATRKRLEDGKWLAGVIDFAILPTLAEYWFDDTARYKTWQDRFMEALHG